MKKIQLPGHVSKIISKLEQNGYEAFAVGGCVRDSLLGKEPKDWDITTSARPEQVKALFRRTIDTGIQHGTVTIMMDHEGYEVTTYRIDGEYEDGRHPKEVVFTPNLVEDLKRRDFTINAMAYSDRTGIVDEFFGMEDLGKKVIRCVGNAEERFTEDALRILRAVRFSAQLGFHIEENTYKAVCDMASTLEKISRERIQAELDKLLMSDCPDRVKLLFETDIVTTIFKNCKSSETCGTVEDLSEKLVHSPKDHFVRWALFISYLPYEDALRSLKFDNRTINVCGRLKKFKDEELGTDRALVRHLIVKLGRDIFRDQYLVYRCLLNTSQEQTRQIAIVFDEIIENKECLSLKTMAVNGGDLKAAGVESGAQMGKILNELFEMVLNDETLNEKEKLLRIVEKIS